MPFGLLGGLGIGRAIVKGVGSLLGGRSNRGRSGSSFISGGGEGSISAAADRARSPITSGTPVGVTSLPRPDPFDIRNANQAGIGRIPIGRFRGPLQKGLQGFRGLVNDPRVQGIGTGLAAGQALSGRGTRTDTNGQMNGVNQIIGGDISDPVLQRVIDKAVGGRLDGYPQFGIETQALQFVGPNGKVMYRSPGKGYVVIPDSGGVAMWRPVAEALDIWRPKDKPLLTAGDARILRRSTAVRRKLHRTAKRYDAVTAPRKTRRRR